MRKIKFRGQDEDNKKWVYGLYCQDSILGEFTHVIQTKDNIGKEAYEEYCIDVNTLGQYVFTYEETEIYEDDVFRINVVLTDSGRYLGEVGETYKLMWQENRYVFRGIDNNDQYEFLDFLIRLHQSDIAEIELLGSIYDNQVI